MDVDCTQCSFKEYLQSSDLHRSPRHAPDDEHEHGDGGVEVYMGHKVGALLFMAATTIIAAIIPIYVRNKISSSSCRKWKDIFMSILLCFGAGNLLGVAFIHLLPHTREAINDAMDLELIPDMHFPLAEVIMCCGFFLIYVIEDMVHGCVGHPHHHNDEDIVMTKTNSATVEVGKDGQKSASTKAKDISTAKDIDNKGLEFDSDKVSTHCTYSSEPTLMKGEYTTVINAVTVVAALSIHDVLEGFSIGLAEKVEDVWLLAGVLVIHKLILAFTIGMELLQEGVKLIPYLAAMITFALATPIGGGIGIASLSVKSKTALGFMVPAVLNGLSAGCILFVIFCEMIERERRRPNGSFMRIVSIMLGFGMIAGLALLPHHSHHSDHPHHSHHSHHSH